MDYKYEFSECYYNFELENNWRESAFDATDNYRKAVKEGKL